MKTAVLVLVFVGIVLVLAGIVSALGVKLDVVKACDAGGSAYRTTWTGQVSDTSGSPLGLATLQLFDYGPDMTRAFETTGTQSSGWYVDQFAVWPSNAGRRYEMDARKTGYDTGSIFVTLPCFEDLPLDLQANSGPYVIYGNFTLAPVAPLKAAFVLTQSYGRVDFFDRSSGGPDHWTWRFGDGSADVTTTLPQLEHNYTRTGTFPVRMTAQRMFSNPAVSYAFANVTVGATAPPSGGSAPAPPAPPSPSDPTGGHTSDSPPSSSGSGGSAESLPGSPDPNVGLDETVFSPSPLTVLLLVSGFAAFAIALVASRA